MVNAGEAERQRTEEAVLLARMDAIADERADGDLTGRQAARATARIQEKLDTLTEPGREPKVSSESSGSTLRNSETRLRHTRPRTPAGPGPAAADGRHTTGDRQGGGRRGRPVPGPAARGARRDHDRDGVQPVGKGGHVFNKDRVAVAWKDDR